MAEDGADNAELVVAVVIVLVCTAAIPAFGLNWAQTAEYSAMMACLMPVVCLSAHRVNLAIRMLCSLAAAVAFVALDHLLRGPLGLGVADMSSVKVTGEAVIGLFWARAFHTAITFVKLRRGLRPESGHRG